MLHLHILSWVLAIILFIATYLNISKNQGGSPFFKPLHMILRLFMLLTLISGFWILIQSFMNGGANHMLLTLKMLCGVAVVGLMEVSIAKRKRHEQSHKMLLDNNGINYHHNGIRCHSTVRAYIKIIRYWLIDKTYSI